jgi:hypothetical protein
MSELDQHSIDEQAEARVRDILRAAASWARDVPPQLTPAIRAVCVRLAEMVADQRHYLAPLPEPRESERTAILNRTAERLRSPGVTQGIEPLLAELAEKNLRTTGSWSLVESPQNEWIAVAILFLEAKARELPAAERPDPWWADDVVAGITASVRAVVGIDELHARTEARYSGGHRKAEEREEG